MKAQHFIVALLGVSGYFIYLVYRPFVQDIAIAVLLAFATQGITVQVKKKLHKDWQVSTFMTLLLGLMFFAPLVYLINATALLVAHIDPHMVKEYMQHFTDLVNSFSLPNDFLARFHVDTSSINKAVAQFFSEQNITSTLHKSISFLGSLAANSAVFFKDMFLILIFYFFTHLYGEPVGQFIKRVLPLDTAQTHLLFLELANSMGVVFFSILATAILEGALFALIVSVYGLDGILLGILYGFASLVPVIGGALMWLPVSIYLWMSQGVAPALMVAGYSIIVISVIADTFIKPVIIKEIDDRLLKDTNALNEILVFFSIVAGLATFGFWGMIIGPAITTLFIAILKLYEQLQSQEIKEES